MYRLQPFVCALLAALMATPQVGFAASHREAPITALDQKADITDFFAFVSYDDPTKVTFILNVDPFLEPGNGPTFDAGDPSLIVDQALELSAEQKTYSAVRMFARKEFRHRRRQRARHRPIQFRQTVKGQKALQIIDAGDVGIKRRRADVQGLREIAHRELVQPALVHKNRSPL